MDGVWQQSASPEKYAYLSFSKKWSAAKAMIWLIMSGLLIYMAMLDPPALVHHRRGVLGSLVNEFGDPALDFIVGGLALATCIKSAIDTWRAFTKRHAIGLGCSGLEVHKSFISVPHLIPLDQIRLITVDRADRLKLNFGEGRLSTLFGSNAAASGARLGARFRAGLKIEYSDERGRARHLTVWDNAVDGGSGSLVCFGKEISMRISHDRR